MKPAYSPWRREWFYSTPKSISVKPKRKELNQ